MRLTRTAIVAFTILVCARSGHAGTLRLSAYDRTGKAMTSGELFEFIAPQALKGKAAAATSALYVMDTKGEPVAGRPWWVAGSSAPSISWSGTGRVKLSLPWPVAEDGFSTVTLDKNGEGYSDGESVLLNEDIARTQFRLFKASLKERRTEWLPPYKASPAASKLHAKAEDEIAAALAASSKPDRAQAFDKALTSISLGWAKMLFEHGEQIAQDRKLGTALRWGLTLDESLSDRLADYSKILKQLDRSGVTWVRLVFKGNPDDFLYATPRSFTAYDHFVEDLVSRKIQIVGSVLDSSLWPKTLTPQALRQRTKNLVLHYKKSIRSWEIASEPNGTCLGGCKTPLPEETVARAIQESYEEVHSADPHLETIATLYWWEGTAGDDIHPTLTWINRPAARTILKNVDVIALSIYPEDNPLGLAFEPVFRAVAERFPSKRVMLGGFGYGSGEKLQGFWWLNPEDIDGARKDLLILYTGAACAMPRSLGGGFFWDSLTHLIGPSREAAETLKVYRKTMHFLRH
ncbi:MAG: hypothetical protein HY078_07575 [Elusimicrobia bacterium]|nr:hypothetical protein [Elusimicrobiota bacterium]